METKDIAQLCGYLGLAIIMFSFQCKLRKKLLVLQATASVAFFAHFMLLGATTGAVLNLLSTIRCVIYFFKEKRWAASPLWMYVFIVAFAVVTAFTWNGMHDLLPLLGCYVYTFATFVDSTKTVRRFLWIGSVCWIIYNYITGSVPGIITELFAISSMIIAIIRLDIVKKR